MANVLIVVDMEDGFLTPGRNLYCGDDARAIIPRVVELVRREQEKGTRVIFTADTHDPDDKEFEMFPPHCIRGTEEAEIIPELRPYAQEIVRKRRYSAFFETDLERRLAEERPELVTICGVCTDICVMHTAADLRNRDYMVQTPADCVASFDQDAHRAALEHMRKILGVQVLESSRA
jgi:nicotinamidase-related amidase